MRHPLENPSLAPVNFTFPLARERLTFETRGHEIDGDRVSVEFWEERHRLNAPRPLPGETILHDVLLSLDPTAGNVETHFTFLGREYHSRDIRVLTTVVQWFGSNVGNCFLRYPLPNFVPSSRESEYWEKFAHEERTHPIASYLLHECSDACGEGAVAAMLNPGNHRFSRHDVKRRDRLVIEALMLWLGSEDGRAYVRAYLAHRDGVLKSAYEKWKSDSVHA